MENAKTPPVVTPQEWEAARQRLLVKEKELTRARDALAAQRRRMPWLAVEKAYEFEGPGGKASLAGLFEGRRQLVIYRAFFEPGVLGWPDHACHGCSMMADQVAHLTHLNARDTAFAYASRAAQPDIARLKARMGWTMPWYTITDEWDVDFGVDQWHGTNAFFRDGDQVFRTYFIDNRGDEALGSTWSYLDMTALGRQELWEDSPQGYPQSAPYDWWNWHDEYDHPELAQGPMHRAAAGTAQGLSRGPHPPGRNVTGRRYGVSAHVRNAIGGVMTIDCRRCKMRGIGCGDCAIASVETRNVTGRLGTVEARALRVLADAGLVPPLRFMITGTQVQTWPYGVFPDIKAS